MKRTLVLFLILLLCMPAAWAVPALNAQMENGVLAVSWTDCGCTQATLTVYRDNWPILVCYVSGADGYFTVPGYYTQPAGDYAVQLRCSDGCVRVEAGSSAPSTPEATPTLPTPPRPAHLNQPLCQRLRRRQRSAPNRPVICRLQFLQPLRFRLRNQLQSLLPRQLLRKNRLWFQPCQPHRLQQRAPRSPRAARCNPLPTRSSVKSTRSAMRAV